MGCFRWTKYRRVHFWHRKQQNPDKNDMAAMGPTEMDLCKIYVWKCLSSSLYESFEEVSVYGKEQCAERWENEAC